MTNAALPPPPRVRSAAIALFLDVDGTLVEIEREPGAVHVPEPLCQILAELEQALDGAVALVSGRSLEQLDRLFSPLRLSAAGLHGLERRNLRREVVRAELDPAIFKAARRRLSTFADQHPGVLLEDKSLTLALHYRNAPGQQSAAAKVAKDAVAASRGALGLLEGKMVFELKPPGCDKGQAIAAFMREAPFAGRQPVFAGDDVTDEAGFKVVNQLGGISIRIGADDRATAAAHGHGDVGTMQTWLADLLAAQAA
ncbi:MAG TPA: trehalose-phosphatase [Geminicoccaceae bacterium]|nr:trehalose-phosphatase [Geminicoccaceae bacterium]